MRSKTQQRQALTLVHDQRPRAHLHEQTPLAECWVGQPNAIRALFPILRKPMLLPHLCQAQNAELLPKPALPAHTRCANVNRMAWNRSCSSGLLPDSSRGTL